MMDLSIVVCTYHRHTLLAQLLASIQAQAPHDELRCDVIVVDNSDEGSALAVVTAAEGPFPVRWIGAHPANISVARNAGVSACASEWIAFVDDDQRLEPGWLRAAAKALRLTTHDGFFGAVDPDFEESARPSPRAVARYSRRAELQDGADLYAMGPRKTRGLALATNNCILRSAALSPAQAPFDLSFGSGGGEDYDLFCRMQARGARFAWVPDLRAREFVPAQRCEPQYLRRRFFAGGQAYASAAARSSARPALARWSVRAKAVVQAAVLASLYPARAFQGEAARADHSFALAGALGKLSFGPIHPLYRVFDQKAASQHR